MNNETIWSNDLNDFLSFSKEYNSVPNWMCGNNSHNYSSISKNQQKSNDLSKKNEILVAKFNEDTFFYYVKTDKKEAFDYCKRCEKNNPNDSVLLTCIGICFKVGIGTKINKNKCFEYLSKAVKIEDSFAFKWCFIGFCYEHGIGTEKNPKKENTRYLCPNMIYTRKRSKDGNDLRIGNNETQILFI